MQPSSDEIENGRYACADISDIQPIMSPDEATAGPNAECPGQTAAMHLVAFVCSLHGAKAGFCSTCAVLRVVSSARF